MAPTSGPPTALVAFIGMSRSNARPARRAAARRAARRPAVAGPSPDASGSLGPTGSPADERTPIGVLLWFGWSLVLLVVTGLLLPRIVGFVDFSERAPFSLLGIFMMIELAFVLFGITVALQRKRVAHRFALAIALLPAPILAGLPPTLLAMPPQAAVGWATLFVPIGVVLSALLVVLLLRPASRAYFSEP